MGVGDNIDFKASQWEFKGAVVDVFEEHVSKSVPLYFEAHNAILSLSDFFIKKCSICYDMGCSTGLLINKIAERHANKNAKFIGIDLECDMIKYAENKYPNNNVSFINADICDYDLTEASLIISYYTLQFIEYKYRSSLLKKIYDSLEPGGAFILYEKVYAELPRFQDILNSVYFDFKVSNGYELNEVLSKSLSIRGVLNPNSTKENLKILNDAGFTEVGVISKYCNFEGYLAIK